MKFTEWGIPWECSQTHLQAILYYKCIDIGRRNSSSGSTSPAAGCPISKFHCHGFVLLLAGILHLGLELSPIVMLTSNISIEHRIHLILPSFHIHMVDFLLLPWALSFHFQVIYKLKHHGMLSY